MERPGPSAAGRRLDAHADGSRHARKAIRPRARRFRGCRRGRRPRRRAARLADSRQAGGQAGDVHDQKKSTCTASASSASTRKRNAAATASSFPATHNCPSTASDSFSRARSASGRSVWKSSKARVLRPTTARGSADVPSITCRPICPPGIPSRYFPIINRMGD